MHVAMVLTDKKIRELVKKEELIVPFNESNLQSESYDVTIGTEITELSKEIHCIDISKQETVDNIYINIDISENGYIISPKQYLLVSLRETLKVPDDISMVGYDGIKLSQILNPKLTTVEQQSRKIGMLAARELIACVENPKTALVKRVVVDGRLLEGETVKDIRQK